MFGKKSKNAKPPQGNPLTPEENKKLADAIMLSVDLKASFELYAYRVLPHADFVHRVDDLVSRYRGIDPMNLDPQTVGDEFSS